MPPSTTLVARIIFAAITLIGWAAADCSYADPNDLKQGTWSGGAAAGFLSGSPDGPEFAFKGHADYFVTQAFSVGPLAQYAGPGNDFLFGLSAQAKYWLSLDSRSRLNFQVGIGFVRAGIKDNEVAPIADTYLSFLLPLGVGYDYIVTRQLAFTADFLLNFTSLGKTYATPAGEVDFHTNVMPALYLGIRF